MKNAEIKRQISSLRLLLKNTSEATKGDLELQAHWARYLCVSAAGILENSVAEIYGAFVKGAASELVANFVEARLDQIRNPNAEKFVQIARSFKVSWGDDLEQFLKVDAQRKDAIDSIMNNRHQISHGNSSGITVARVSAYLDKAEEVLEFIETQTLI